MKKRILLLLLVPLFGYAQTNGLTLAETRSRVLAGNPSVREAIQRVAAAEAVLKQAKSAYLPTITMTGSYGHADASLHPDADPNTRYSDSFKQGSVGLEANWLLFDGFARRARTLAADYGVQQVRELSEETDRLLILSATVAFRQAQLARESVEIAERDFAYNTNLEDDARKRFNAGTLPEADVYNFSIRALQAESAALQAQLDYDTARAVLAELMALPEAILPEAMSPVAIGFGTLADSPQLEVELKYALFNRPDYKALQSGQLLLAQQVRAAKGDLYPKVALTGNVNYADRDGFSSVEQHGNHDAFVGVAASWELFSGGRKVNAIKEVQSEMYAMDEQREALRLSIRSSLRRRIDEANTAKAVYERQGKIYELTKRVRESVEKSYKAGVASITRLNEAQTDLTRARGAYSASYISYQLTLNQLDIETGRVLIDL